MTEETSIIPLIESHFNIPFNKILDIGAGKALQGKELQKLYGSELWILEGDDKNNNKKSKDARKVKWNGSADNFLYYWNLDNLKHYHNSSGTTNYHILDCDNLNIPEDIKFDLICSWLSCGFHYSLSTYYDVIKKHSHSNTKYVFDIRIDKDKLLLPPEATVVHTFITYGRKFARCEIKFNF